MLVRLAVGFLALDLVALAYTLEYDLLLVLLYDLGWAIFSLLYAVISVILVHRRSSVLAATTWPLVLPLRCGIKFYRRYPDTVSLEELFGQAKSWLKKAFAET